MQEEEEKSNDGSGSPIGIFHCAVDEAGSAGCSIADAEVVYQWKYEAAEAPSGR